jgi:hypothetical protein
VTCDGCPASYHSRCIGLMKMHLSEVADKMARGNVVNILLKTVE